MDKHRFLKYLLFCCTIIAVILCYTSSFAAGERLELLSIHARAVKNHQVEVSLVFNKNIPKPYGFMLNQPPQFILDIPNADISLKQTAKVLNLGVLRKYEAISTASKTRIAFELEQSSEYQMTIAGNCLYVIFSRVPISTSPIKNPLFRPSAFSRGQTNNNIKDIDYRRAQNGGGDLVISLEHINSEIDVKPQSNQIELTFVNTSISPFWERKLDVGDFDTAAKSISVYARGKNVVMDIAITDAYQQTSYISKNRFVLNIVKTVQENPNVKKNKVYSGKPLTLNFQTIPVRAALQLLARFANINIVVSDSVTGNITLNVRSIPWDEAMDIILQTRNLGQYKIGNVTLIAPEDEIAAQEKQQLLAKQQISGLEPLRSELVQVNYAKASEIAALLKSQNSTILSSRGSVSVDSRTNTLWVMDTANKLSEIRDLVARLDIPVRQVLIEARIVNVDTRFIQEIGIRWGITNPNHLSGSLDAANQIADGVAPSEVNPITQRLNVDLPAQASNSATMGLALAKLSNDILLDLELSAIESQGDGKIIASPRLITANQKEATIESGEEIPYQQATSSGATAVAFKKAVLSLKVTPQITPDNRVILSLKVNQDKRGTPEVLGVPPIDTRQIETQVLVNNGQTVVLGGIFQRDRNNQIDRVPFLGSIPLVGNLFRYKKEDIKQQELLIFVTPKIIKQAQIQE